MDEQLSSDFARPFPRLVRGLPSPGEELSLIGQIKIKNKT